jgi:hypothetical protein
MREPNLENELVDMFRKKLADLVKRLKDRTFYARYYKKHMEANAKACIEAQRIAEHQNKEIQSCKVLIDKFLAGYDGSLQDDTKPASEMLLILFGLIRIKGQGNVSLMSEVAQLNKKNETLENLLEHIRFLLHMKPGETFIGANIEALQSTIKEREAETNSYKELKEAVNKYSAIYLNGDELKNPTLRETVEGLKNSSEAHEELLKELLDHADKWQHWMKKYDRLISLLKRASKGGNCDAAAHLEVHRDNEKKLKAKKK